MKRAFYPVLLVALAALVLVPILRAVSSPRKILFFTKSSGYEHSVISWKDGKPSVAEKALLELGKKNDWEFTFSKDGSLFSPEYLAQFDTVMFYTTGDLCSAGTDGNPPMTPAGKEALFAYVRSGKGFVGTHSASDTFHTGNEAVKGPERYLNHGEKADDYVRFLGGEFIKHGKQQIAKNTVTDAKFPGFEAVGSEYSFLEEWYSLKDFTPDLHVLSVIDAPSMEGVEYERPAYPSTWARKEADGRVFYTAMGHRDDIWTNPVFQTILVGGMKWALGDIDADVTPNLKAVAPGAYTNPPYVEPAPPKPVPAKPVPAKPVPAKPVPAKPVKK